MCAAHARGLKKEIVMLIQGLFVGSAEIINPNPESGHFRSEVVCPNGARFCQLEEIIKAVRHAIPCPPQGPASLLQGRGKWACFLFKGSDFNVEGLFVFPARSFPWHCTRAPNSLGSGFSCQCVLGRPAPRVSPGPASLRPVLNVWSLPSWRTCFLDPLAQGWCTVLVPGTVMVMMVVMKDSSCLFAQALC